MTAHRHTRILVVDDEEIVRESLSGWLEKDGYSVAAAADGPSALAALEAEPFAVVLLDLKMPGMDGLEVLEHAQATRPGAVVVLMTAYATVDTAVRAIKAGAYDYLVKPFDPEELSLLIAKIVRQQEVLRENTLLRRALRKDHQFRDLVSKSPAMKKVFDVARTAARSPSTVLVLGESGTGKELLARAIHAESARAGQPFIAVSCAALPETLLESELFGYERGAFTGAQARHRGKFELAHRGTLFLDEIGDVSPKLQADLLRVLESRRFYRLGGTEPLQVDVRIVAATNRDLPALVRAGTFRDDLYYRLNVIALTIPPLRQRREDIPLLVDHFLETLQAETGRSREGLTAEAMDVVMAHDWPGNVRELKNVLERALVVSAGPLIEAADLGLAPGMVLHAPFAGASLEAVEKAHVASVLESCRGNVSQAARVLGIDRVTLYHKIKKYGLRRLEPATP
jgi:DNA-binding NtrC family response regulator